jgi:Tol biopolymer transport system component
MRRTLLAALIVSGTLGSGRVEAQYFGKNQVQYRHLEFLVIETEHFDVYYYERERQAALDAARMAERAYARLSRLLSHKYRERQPIILFASHTEFQQNNIGPVDEATGGFTEWYRHRILVPFTGSYADVEHVLEHELVHQFQMDIFARGRVGAGIQRLMAVNPPLWFMEGMAEYLSSGPITPHTAVWLRDAALDRGLPSLDELTWDPSYTPYRFGHALWSYVGERWGDDTVGEILHAAAVSGTDGAFRRVLGLDPQELVAEWHDAIQRTYLPQLADLQQAGQFAQPLLTRDRSSGRVHIAPSISPDGSDIVYLSEGNSFFIDLYLADAETGRVKRRMIKSAFSTDFESLRFLNSVGSWSPDGRYFAFAAKRGGRDDLVLFDVAHNRVATRIRIPLDGLTTPSWSPDGQRLVFTGYDGGVSDLFLIQADGTDLRRLTDDRHADLHPAWAPDGRSIAFATDRSATTDWDRLRYGGLAVALYDLGTRTIDVLDGMVGNNLNPQWAPDSRSLAFVSDRTGIPNVFLYDREERTTYQLTDVFTGVTGVTPLSPAISWAPRADRLVFSYFEDGAFNVYGMDDPRGLRQEPWDPDAPRPLVASLLTDHIPTRTARGTTASRRERYARRALETRDADSTVAVDNRPYAKQPLGGSFYRADDGLRESSHTDSTDIRVRAPSLIAVLDSTAMTLPDPQDFAFREYSVKFSPDYIVQPTVGYVRDNFGSGVYGGTAISLSDMLGNHRMLMAAQVNGNLGDSQLLGVYANLSRRINWAVGISQTPLYYFSATGLGADTAGRPARVTALERYVFREAFAEAYRPFNRFRRLEFSLRLVNVERDVVSITEPFDPGTGLLLDQTRETRSLGSANYLQPSIAAVFDNSVSLWVGPWMGRRSRLEYAPAIGEWSYHQVLADYRRYDTIARPFTLATRLLFFGRFGGDNDEFPVFLGRPELVRGYTAGSMRDNECLSDESGSYSGCAALDQLIGTRIATFNAEIRFPLTRSVLLGFAPIGLPPIEGAVFFDAGIAWDDRSAVRLSRSATDNKEAVRVPVTSWGISLRANVLGVMILRFDYARPLTRADQGSYWIVSLGPTF